MPRPFRSWTVLPHRTLTLLDDGRLVVYSAIALHEDEMRSLEELGAPAVLVVPSAIHRMDARIWKQRCPAMTCTSTPPGSICTTPTSAS